jgi:hypothetical protein
MTMTEQQNVTLTDEQREQLEAALATLRAGDRDRVLLDLASLLARGCALELAVRMVTGIVPVGGDVMQDASESDATRITGGGDEHA